MTHAVTPFSLKDAPALIERLLPVQKLSAEAYKEQMAVAGKTLTALGSYWKGRKPLILNKACVLGCLLPATDNPTKDLEIFEKLMCLLHPYMPFITEEIWQALNQRNEGESICRTEFPKGGEVNTELLASFDVMFELVTKIREVRNVKQLSPKIALPLAIKTDDKNRYENIEYIIEKLANTETITYVADKVDNAISFVVKSDEFFIILEGEIDVEAELEAAQKDLEYNLGFKKATEAKLANERFVANAKPELVERERQKLADAEVKIKALEERIASLKQ